MGMYLCQPAQLHAQSVSSYSLEEIRADGNGDGLPDHIGERVTVTGIVTLGTGRLQQDSSSVFIQDLSSGIRLTGLTVDHFVAERDSVDVVGRVRFESGGLALSVDEVTVFGKAIFPIKPLKLSRSIQSLAPYEGMLVYVDGYIKDYGEDHLGNYFILSTHQDIFVVRLPRRTALPPAEDEMYEAGVHVTVSGVLASTEEMGAHIIPSQLLTRSASDIKGDFIPARFLPWIGLSGICVVLMILLFIGNYWRRKIRKKWSKYATIFEEMGGAVIVMDLDMRIIEVNAATGRLFRSPRNSFRFKHLLDVIQTNEQKESIQNELETNGQKTIDAVFHLKDGSTIDVKVAIHLAKIEDQVRIISSIHDVSAEREKFRRYESFLETFIEGSPIQVVIQSNEGKYFYINPEAVPDGKLREWLIGKSDFEYCREHGIHVEVALRRRGFRKQAVENKEVISFEESISTTPGEERHYLRIYSPHVDPNGEVNVVACFGLETTELKQALESLKEAQGESEKMMRLKEAFLQNVSHELRTPVTGIIGYAQVIKNEVPKRFYEFVDNIERSGKRLMDALNRLLDIAGLHAEDIVLAPRILSLEDEVKKVVTVLETEATDKNLFLKVKPISTESLVYLDQPSLHRILHNLIRNAIKFTVSGGVIVEVSQAANQAVFRVIDSGVGIDEQFMSQLYDEFYQEELSSSRSYEGLGLGLAVTKRLVKALGGTIAVQSTKGEGTMFTVAFPLALVDVERLFGFHPAILVADRNAETIRLTHFLLDEYFEVDDAPSLEQTLSRMDGRDYNMILMDVKLEPDVEETALIEYIRRKPGYDNIPVVGLGTKDGPGNVSTYKNFGYDQYLSKPYNKLTLLNVLTEQLAKEGMNNEELIGAEYQ